MKVIGVTEFGGPEALGVHTLPEPHPGPGEVRIRARATAVSPTDLLSCGTVQLFCEIIAAGGRDHLLMVDLLKCRKCSDGSPITAQLVGADRLWNVEFSKQSNQERSCHFGISVAVQQDALHEPVLVHSE